MKKLYLTAFIVFALGFTGMASAENSNNIQTVDSLKAETIVTVAGTVERIRDEDEFILKDDTGSIKVYIGSNRMPVKQGDVVTVEGMFDNDIIKREIYAHIIMDAEGNITKLEKRYE